SPTACARRASRSEDSRSSSAISTRASLISRAVDPASRKRNRSTSARRAANSRRQNSPRVTEMAVKVPIFMDNHSTTPVDPRVLDAMLPFFREDFGNAASRNHVFGWRAEKAVEIAREQVGALI